MTSPAAAYSRVVVPWAVRDAEHPNGHRGTDYPSAAGAEVPAYARCTVVSTPFSPILGWCTIVQYGPGDFGGWAHLRKGTRPNVGAVLDPGERVGITAAGPVPREPLAEAVAPADYPGTAWTGPHTHTTRGPILSHLFSGQTVNPAPLIARALAGPAVAGTTITPILEDTMSESDARNALINTRGNDGRNVLDSVLQARAELAGKAQEGAAAALFNTRVANRNVFDWFLQNQADRAAAEAKDAARDAALLELVRQIAGPAGADPAAIVKAAQDGARAALAAANFPSTEAIAQAVLDAEERAELAALRERVADLERQG